MSLLAADFDGAWTYALEQYMPACLELFFPQVYAGIDWRMPIIFADKELQQINPEANTGKLRVDKLIQVTRNDGQPLKVFVHVEVQAQSDASFAKRMYRYHTRLFDRNDAPVVSVAILADDDPTWHPQTFAYDLWGSSVTMHFPTVKLVELDTALLEATANPMATITLIHREAQVTHHDPEERMRRKLARFRACLRQGYSGDDLRHLYRLLDQLLRLPTSKDAPARATMREIEQEESGMDTFVTSIERLARDEGLTEGMVKGKAEGEIKGQLKIVLRLLIRKVGTLDAPVREQVEALAPDALLDLSEALLDFTTLDDLVAWLGAVEHHG